jgi:hypothetical protein
MELLKSKVLIQKDYKPSLDLDYMEFFNRAMVFSQTNYKEELEKTRKLNFRKLAPTTFYEEYVWNVCILKQDTRVVSEYFPLLIEQLSPYFKSLWDLNSLPQLDDLKSRVLLINNEPAKIEAIHNCANIINRGIKLFGWEKYRSNFLNTPEKLSVLPMLGIVGGKNLFASITIYNDVVGYPRLHNLAEHWGFADTKALCEAIAKRIALPLRIIELILWYATDDLVMSNS